MEMEIGMGMGEKTIRMGACAYRYILVGWLVGLALAWH
jgi:hypothetical protein